MGGFLGLAGAISGIGSAMRERNLLEAEQERIRRDQTADLLFKIGTSGNVADPNMALSLIRDSAQIMSHPLHKKLPKELEQRMQMGEMFSQLQKPYQPPPMRVGAQTIENPLAGQYQQGKSESVPGGLVTMPPPPEGIGRIDIPAMNVPQDPMPGFLTNMQLERQKEARALQGRLAVEREQAALGTAAKETDRKARRQEALQLGLTDPRDIATYVNTGRLDRPTLVPVPPPLQGPPWNLGPTTDPHTLQAAVTLAGQAAAGERGMTPDEIIIRQTLDKVSQRQGRPLTGDEELEIRKTLRQEFAEQASRGLYAVMTPEGPRYMPRTEATGRAPVITLFDEGGRPSTGGANVSRTPPPTLPEGTQDKIYGTVNALDQFSDVNTMLGNPKFATLGPAIGRVKLAEIEKLGGVGATADQIELATTLRFLLRTQAFQEGGKQLTGTELEQFVATTPSLNDTLQQAVVKTNKAIQILRRNLRRRIQILTPRQREQVHPDIVGLSEGTGRTDTLPAPPLSDAARKRLDELRK